MFEHLSFTGFREQLAAGRSLESVITECWQQIEDYHDKAVWIWRPTLEDILASLPSDPTLPLYGLPFAVKDNIDVAGWPTTAGCPEYRRVAEVDAAAVARLRAAGAVPIGKTNLDQFATGLVGTRSPYGAPTCVHDSAYISGGSSSGSAVAVAAGLCAFSLGTDTAGSGRIPAAFNGIIGLKPTRGRISTTGVLPACRSLDCVSVFASNCADAAETLEIMQGKDSSDPYSRPFKAPSIWPASLRIGIPMPHQLEFFGDAAYAACFKEAVEKAASLGAQVLPINFEPFSAAAQLLYAGPWVAERAAAVGDFVAAGHAGLDPTVAAIIGGATKWTARDAFSAAYQLETLRGIVEQVWHGIDALLLPTAPTHYRVAEVLADPVVLNSRLGIYTNFVNLLDLCAIAVPAGTVAGSQRPFGVTFMAPAWQDQALVAIAKQFAENSAICPPLPGNSISVCVAGAHLAGMPLHHQLVRRKARFLARTRTASGYRLHALKNTTPPKPGLVRDPGFSGTGIEVEVYALSPADFGTFVAEIPAPLGIGNVELADGTTVKGFLCEPYCLESALEITEFGGWRAWIDSKRAC